MTLVWVLLGVVAVAIVGAVVLAGVRDRRRVSSADDAAANRTATAGAERHAAERHGVQGGQWQRGQGSGPS